MKVRITSKMRGTGNVSHVMDVNHANDLRELFNDVFLSDVCEAFDDYLNTGKTVDVFGGFYEVSETLEAVDPVRYRMEFEYFLESLAEDIYDYIVDECEYDDGDFEVDFVKED